MPYLGSIRSAIEFKLVLMVSKDALKSSMILKAWLIVAVPNIFGFTVLILVITPGIVVALLGAYPRTVIFRR